MSLRSTRAILAVLLSGMALSRGLALDIELSYAGGFDHRFDAVLAMEHAAATWEAVLSDPFTIQIEVREVSIFELPFGAQGGAFPIYDGASFDAVRAALFADATSTDDELAVAHLPPGPRISFRTWDANQNAVINSDDDAINRELQYPRANARALGLPINPKVTGPDAEVKWSDFFLDHVFDFDRSNGIDGTDFLGVAIHELGHALGFGSGVDAIDGIFAGFIPVSREEISDYAVRFPLDLFRYTAESLPVTDLTPGGAPYFSLDGGATRLANFASGENFGDGWQAGHWQVGHSQGIMDANLPDDAIHNLTALDLRAMDAIGWDLAEPGDFNNDGTVNDVDYSRWRATFGSVVELAADGNRNGIVDAADYVTFRHHFADLLGGESGRSATFAIPEPATAMMLIVATFAMCRRPVAILNRTTSAYF